MPYLRHKTTGEVYPLNEHLLKRGDFDEIESLDAPAAVQEEVVLEAPKAARKPRAKKAEAAAVEAPAPDDRNAEVVDTAGLALDDLDV